MKVLEVDRVGVAQLLVDAELRLPFGVVATGFAICLLIFAMTAAARDLLPVASPSCRICA